MEQTPLISVIVPIYNILEYLPRCVHSITGQTWKQLEILLIDDGSTDGTAQLCDTLALEDPRIRVFHKQNGGSSSARNLGISQARGEYLGFIDSDDYAEPDMYEKLIRAAIEEKADIVQIGRDEVDPDGNRRPDICTPPEKQCTMSSQDFLRELLMHRGDCSFCTKIIHRDCFKNYQFPIGVLNEDFRLLVQLLTQVPEVVMLPGYGYHVFYRVGSNTRMKDKEQFSRVYGDCVDNADMALALTKAQYPQLVETAYRFSVFQRLEYLLHIPINKMTADNQQYQQIVAWMRKYWLKAMGNKELTVKNKIYHTLFAIAPRQLRVFHKKLRRL